jgi:hypothetical protein
VDPLRVEAEARQPAPRKAADGTLPIVRGCRQTAGRNELEPRSLALGLETTFSNEIIELIVGERAGEADDLILLHVARQHRKARHIRLEAEVAVGLSVQPIGPRHAIDPGGV